MVAETERYNGISREFLQEAHEYLSIGDLAQASEKGWGAAAVKLKSVAVAKGEEHAGHRQLWGIINKIAQDTGDDGFRSLFGFAGELHTNFYEQWLDQETVTMYLDRVGTLIRKLDAIVPEG